jgi:hypothetical protein
MVTNIPGTLPDPEDQPRTDYYGRTPTELDLLAEQLLVLKRIERSLETLMTLGNRQANALEELAREIEEEEEES